MAVPSLALLSLFFLAAPPPIVQAADVSPDAVQGLIQAGHYSEAESQARELLHEIEEIHGKESLDAANVLDLLSDALRLGGKASNPEALAICERALRIKAMTVGDQDVSYAKSLHNCGALHLARGEFELARSPLRRALELRERALGPDHLEVARSLLYLGHLEILLNHEAEARPLVERAIAIQAVSLLPDDPERARGLNMLGSILYRLGDYRTAGAVWEESLGLNRRALGVDHPRVAESLHNLGILYGEIGDTEEALRYLHRALEIRRKTLGRNHPLVASTLTAIASTMYAAGDLRGASKRFRDARSIQARAYPDGHASLAWTLLGLGRLAIDEGHLDRARALLDQALAMQRRTLGENHPHVAWTLKELAEVARRRGARREALADLERSTSILRAAYGAGHPDLNLSLGRYARVLFESGNDSLALRIALEASRDRVAHLRLTARGLSERQALRYSLVGAQGLNVALTLAAQARSGHDIETIEAVWDALIRSRTVVLDEMAARHHASGQPESPAAVALRRELDDARHRLANLLVRGIGSDAPEHYRSIVARAQQESERAERALALQSVQFRSEQAEARIGYADVRDALPPNTAIAAFALYDSSDTRAYIAFVLAAGSPPAAVTLGPETKIDEIVRRWAATVTQTGGPTRAGRRRAEAACRSVGEELRRAIWDPVVSRTHASDRVLVVMDGALNLVSLAALPRGDGYLAEVGPAIQYLSSERSLVPKATGAPTGTGLLALGGPEYDHRPSATDAVGEGPSPDDARSSTATPGGARGEHGPSDAVPGRGHAPRGILPDCASFRETRFPPLPESVREVEEIDSLWGDSAQTIVLTGSRARESAFKRSAPGRRVLHLATHGFFLDARGCAGWSPAQRGIGGVTTEEAVTKPPPPAVTAPEESMGSPLLLSGLALAGANVRYATSTQAEDGILTAEEVASLDLNGVQWVVLSACDTGLGRVQPGESVLGLRRSFEIAGAQTLIMSLWGVDDRSARLWMRGLYEARFRRDRATIDAVRDASLGVLRYLRAQGRSTHPFYWAAFVAVGDWN